MSAKPFNDPVFRTRLFSLILKDRSFLNQCSPILTEKDFKLKSNSSKTDKIQETIAELGLAFYKQFNEPMGSFVKAELKKYAKTNHLSDSWKEEAFEVARALRQRNVKAPDYVIQNLIEYKKEIARANALQKFIEAQESGELTDALWIKISQEGLLQELQDKFKPVDYLKRLSHRIERRKLIKDNRYPCLFIEDLDRRVRIVARGQLGLCLAPYKRGKSLFLLHVAWALLLQQFNVLFITLEDPLEDVEDRFDAAFSFVEIKHLTRKTKALKERFNRFRRHLRKRLKMVDGTEGGMTVARINSIIDQERNQGFIADAVIIDYDEEIQPAKQHRDRRMEFDEIYRDLRRSAAKRQQIWWTAAQTKRGTMTNKILTGDDISEDISKIKKASIVISLGAGDWGEDSLYLHVAAHKNDKQHVGCNIVSDFSRMRIYDPDKTRKARDKHPEMVKKDK